ncbi:S-adenosyl-L-methionine-dependent methyltransferase [Ramaria rubella]|nr:S-adenosyl-L-methionine-dependent methyltransferase [Ramaria rubella]
MIRALEFYSGIGGLHFALQRSGVNARVVRAFDWDPAASQVYNENCGANIVQRTDISRLTAADLSVLNASLWLLSPACQPYTVLNPSAKGGADPRAKSFLHLIETVLPELATTGSHPRWVLVENVAGFETSSTRLSLLSSLNNLGYNVAEFLLTPLQFSIPNSRLRYYLLAKLGPLTFAHSTLEELGFLQRSIPNQGIDWVDPRRHKGSDSREEDCPELCGFLDHVQKAQDPAYWRAFAVPDKVLQKKGVLFDIVTPHSRRTCCFTGGYTRMVEGTSILQMNDTLDTTTTFDSYVSLAANHDTDSLRLLHALRLRYFTPDELLRLFYFTPPVRIAQTSNHIPQFRWPPGISQKTKYRLIGNSVNVKVVQELIMYLFKENKV